MKNTKKYHHQEVHISNSEKTVLILCKHIVRNNTNQYFVQYNKLDILTCKVYYTKEVIKHYTLRITSIVLLLWSISRWLSNHGELTGKCYTQENKWQKLISSSNMQELSLLNISKQQIWNYHTSVWHIDQNVVRANKSGTRCDSRVCHLCS